MGKARRCQRLNAVWATAGFLFAAFCGPQAGNASPRSLEQLLRDVTAERAREQLESKEREQRFLEARNQRQAMLDEARQILIKEQAQADRLKQQFDADDALIQEKTKVLHGSQGVVGGLHRIVRQSASDLTAITESSLVSAQFPEGTAFLRRLFQSQEFPSIDDLEKLWYTLLQHMLESGKISRFKAKIIARDGAEKERLVTRVGTFDAITDGEFLRYQPTTQRLSEPVRQPPVRLQSLVRVFETSDQELCELPIDPTRGTSLDVLLQKPGLLERVQQRGVIGYVLMALGFAVFLVVVNHYPAASALGRKVRGKSGETNRDDADLGGRITKGDADKPHIDSDAVVLREPPRRRLSLAAIVGLAALVNVLLFYFIYRLAAPQFLKLPRYEMLRPVTFIRMPKPQEAHERRQREQTPQRPKPQTEQALAKMAVVNPQKPKLQRPKIAAPRVGLASMQIGEGPYLGDFQSAPVEDDLSFSGPLELDTNAVPIVRVDPPYPARALRAGIEGRVTVEFTITAAGGVNDPVIAKADPPGIFDQAVLAVITKWKFKPRVSAGVAVARRARQIVEFSVRD